MLSSMHFNRILVVLFCESRGSWPYTRRCGAGCRFRRRWCSCSGVSSTLIVFRDGYDNGSVSVSLSPPRSFAKTGCCTRRRRCRRTPAPRTRSSCVSRTPPRTALNSTSAFRMEDTKFSGTITIPPNTDPISVARSTYTGRCEFVVYFLVFALVARQIRRVELPRVVWRACARCALVFRVDVVGLNSVVGFGGSMNFSRSPVPTNGSITCVMSVLIFEKYTRSLWCRTARISVSGSLRTRVWVWVRVRVRV
jgi:hypothetical protein